MKQFFVASASVALFLSGPNAVAGDVEFVDALLTTSEISCDDIGVEQERLVYVVKALKAEILSQLQQGESVQLDGFGTFYLERMETTMQAGTKFNIPGREMVRFKAHNPAWMTGEKPRVAHVLTKP